MCSIYVLGDSISMEYGPYLQRYLRWIAEYARKEGHELATKNLDVPDGANGGDSSMVLRFLRAMAGNGGIDADLLLVNCGLHDIKVDPQTGRRQIPIDQYRDNLRSIVQTVATMRPRLVWVRTTPCDEAIHNHPGMTFHRFTADGDAYNAVADSVMNEAGIPMIDLHTFTLNIGIDLYRDHVHFHDHICEKQGAFLAGWIAATLPQLRAKPLT